MRLLVTFRDGVRIVVDAISSYSSGKVCNLITRYTNESNFTDLESLEKRYVCIVAKEYEKYCDATFVKIRIVRDEIKSVESINC